MPSMEHKEYFIQSQKQGQKETFRPARTFPFKKNSNTSLFSGILTMVPLRVGLLDHYF